MPMATAEAVNSSAEAFTSQTGLIFQRASYANPAVIPYSVHSSAVQQEDGNQRLPHDAAVPVSSGIYGGNAFVAPYELFLTVTEQPKNKWRYRYQSEKGSHGGLPGESSTQTKKTFPTVKLNNYDGTGQVFIKASLWTSEGNPTMHVHKLQGMNCESDGTCILKLNDDCTAVLQDVTILFVAKKEVSDILLHRKLKEYNIACISGEQTKHLQKEAEQEAKNMNLNSVKICFEAFFCPADTNEFISICKPVFSNPVANQKSPDAGDLKISRIDKVAGYASGGDEVFLLCTKVNKKDIKVRFFENGSEWHEFGKFSEADVHYQYAIVFKTPPYHTINISAPVTVFLQLQRSSGETSDSREFTYLPNDPDDERVRKKPRRNDIHEGSHGSAADQFGAVGASSSSTQRSLETSLNNGGSVNGNSLGSSSGYAVHKADMNILSDLDINFLMESSDSSFMESLNGEDVFENVHPILPTPESGAENFSSEEVDGALIEPHKDPLLSEANVYNPIWNLHSRVRIEGNMFEGVSSNIKTDSGVSTGVHLENLGRMIIDQKLNQANEELVEALKKLSILEETCKKKDAMPDITPITSHMRTIIEESARKYGRCAGIDDAVTRDTDASWTGDPSCLWMKRLFNNLSNAATEENQLPVPKEVLSQLDFRDSDQNTLLHLAVMHHPTNEYLVKTILKIAQCASHNIANRINKNCLTPLHLAVKRHAPELIKFLLQYGADPMIPDKYGYSPIHMAVIKNDTDCLFELLTRQNYENSPIKLNLEHANHDGLTAIHLAAREGFAECLAALWSCGADVNVPSGKEGRTALHFAVDQDIAVLDVLLVWKSIDVDAQDYGGNTALHLACALKRSDIVKRLIAHDASPWIQNYDYSDSDSFATCGRTTCDSAADNDSSSVRSSGKTAHDFADDDEKIKRILNGEFEEQSHVHFNADDRRSRKRKPVKKPKRAVPMCQESKPPPNGSTGRSESFSQTDSKSGEHYGDSGYISGSISQLHEEAMKQLRKLLDPPSESWRTLSLFTGIDESLAEDISKLTSRGPTKAIIDVFLRDGNDIAQLINVLEAANLFEARDIVIKYHS